VFSKLVTQCWIAQIRRGIIGSYNHFSEHYLSRYVGGFLFRWGRRKIEDGERMVKTIWEFGVVSSMNFFLFFRYTSNC
jgi:hypothetical protein